AVPPALSRDAVRRSHRPGAGARGQAGRPADEHPDLHRIDALHEVVDHDGYGDRRPDARGRPNRHRCRLHRRRHDPPRARCGRRPDERGDDLGSGGDRRRARRDILLGSGRHHAAGAARTPGTRARRVAGGASVHAEHAHGSHPSGPDRAGGSRDGSAPHGARDRAPSQAARGAEIYVGYGGPAGVVQAARGTLKWAHTGTAGVGASLPHLKGTGVVLTNSAAVHADPIADWAIAAIAYFARGLDRLREFQVAERWARVEFADLEIAVREFGELRVGVFGLGGIGGAVARRALALGMRVAGVRRHPERGGPPGVRWVGGPGDLGRLAAESDCLVIAAPHTRETVGVVTREVLERLPTGAIVVNVSRGTLLDEAGLLDLLDAARIRGAALDVFWWEPLPARPPLWLPAGVRVGPHVASVTTRFWEREPGLVVEDIRRYLAGAPI